MASLARIMTRGDLAVHRLLAKPNEDPERPVIPVHIPGTTGWAYLIPEDIQQWFLERYAGEDVYYQFVGKIDQTTFRHEVNAMFFFDNPEFAFEFKIKWC